MPDCPICGGTGWVLGKPSGKYICGTPVPCKCTEGERESRKATRLRELSGIEDNGLTFDTFFAEKCVGDRKRMSALVSFLEGWSENPKGWIVLEGPYGCGKTHLAYACANKMLERGIGAHIASMPDLLKTLKDGIGDEKNDLNSRLDLMSQCSVLVIDDLGTENPTAWARESVFLIFNTRYRNRLPMLITTNEPIEDKQSKIDPRIKSRMSEGTKADHGFCRYIHMPCSNYRPFKEEE